MTSHTFRDGAPFLLNRESFNIWALITFFACTWYYFNSFLFAHVVPFLFRVLCPPSISQDSDLFIAIVLCTKRLHVTLIHFPYLLQHIPFLIVQPDEGERINGDTSDKGDAEAAAAPTPPPSRPQDVDVPPVNGKTTKAQEDPPTLAAAEVCLVARIVKVFLAARIVQV